MRSNIKRLGQIGQDASVHPFPTDWKLYLNNMLVKTYFDQPNIARQMCGTVIPIQYDGKYEAEIPAINDLDDPEIGMEPGIADTELDGDLINVKTPQIFQTMRLSDDKWAQLFAGQGRENLVMSRMGIKIQNKEDIYTFQGKTGITSGLISDATTLGSPSGAWGAATNGKLTYAIADIRNLLATLDSEGIPNTYPVDLALTSYAYTLLDTTVLDYNPDITNKMLIERLLRGGRILQSNNVQSATVTSAVNSMFASVRAPASDPGWVLLASGLDIAREPVMWGHRIGVRQKVGYKILNAKLVYKMTGITSLAA